MSDAQTQYPCGGWRWRSGELMHDVASPLRGENLSVATFLKQPAQWENSVLGVICFSTDAVESPMQAMQVDLGIPCIRVPMQRLDADDAVCEVWHGSGRITKGQSGAVHYRHDDNVLFGVIALPDADTDTRIDNNKTPLQQATESAYRQVFALLDKLHYPHLFRFWNYITDINGHSFGLERYRQFNLGRQDAFLVHGRDVAGESVPAACAVGTAQGPLTIAFLAGRVAPLNIENPRQISAYQYPQQYGPRSPTFSRASLVRLGQDELLFISGTASIVGHATLHPTDVMAQTQEIITNIKAVLAEANRRASPPGFGLSDLHYKVYVRAPTDLAQIRAELARCVGGEDNMLKAIYLQADLCRQELLLEIEATTVVHPLISKSSQQR